MVSIIIPVYNQADKIKKTLESIAKQSYQNYEVIIVNDGSKDNLEEVCAAYLKKLETNNRYLFLNQASNQFAPVALYRGVQESRCDYL